MDIASSVLARPRVAIFAALFGGVLAWSIVTQHLASVSKWATIAIASVGVIPAMLGLILVALPLWRRRWLFPAAIALVVLAVILWVVGWHIPANFAKLFAATLLGWAFLALFERVSWILMVAIVIPFVDLISVWRGPTHTITSHHIGAYNDVAIAFPLPGGPYEFGPPDIIFFALFLAAAARWKLRVSWTWIAMTAMYSSTVVIAANTSVRGLAGLPFLSFGFLVANGDLLWRAIRPSADSSGSSPASS